MLRRSDSEIERMAARLDLCRMGWRVGLKRVWGRINEVAVLVLDGGEGRRRIRRL